MIYLEYLILGKLSMQDLELERDQEELSSCVELATSCVGYITFDSKKKPSVLDLKSRQAITEFLQDNEIKGSINTENMCNWWDREDDYDHLMLQTYGGWSMYCLREYFKKETDGESREFLLKYMNDYINWANVVYFKGLGSLYPYDMEFLKGERLKFDRYIGELC